MQPTQAARLLSGCIFLEAEQRVERVDAFRDVLERNPVIAAVKSREALAAALSSPVEVIFLLSGNICEIKDVVAAAAAGEKRIYIHIDLLEGIGRDQYALKFLSEYARPSGIITTKAGLVKSAREFGLYAIQRLFLLDSMALETGLKALERNAASPNALEILPGILPDIIATFAARTEKPIIAGGLIRSKEDAILGLKAGAMGVSTSNQSLWRM